MERGKDKKKRAMHPKSLKNLKPFKKGEYDERQRKGTQASKNAERKTISQFLRDLGNASKVEYSVTVTDLKGETKIVEGKVDAGEGSINHLVAAALIIKASQGDMAAISEVLNRQEGAVPRAKLTEVPGEGERKIITLGGVEIII